MTDLTEKTDAELHQLITDAKTILRRRESEREAGIVIDAEIRRHAQASGRNLEDGQPFVQPTGAHDAYPKGQIVTHDGKTWVSLVSGNVWEPGVSGWREVVENEEGSPGIPEWVQPSGAHDAYQTGDEVMFEGVHYRSVIDGNTWSPADYPAGWEAV